MFWGLIMEPNRRYSQTVEKSFHVSMASLDSSTADDKIVQVMLYYDNHNYLLCSLQKGQTWQVPLDLNFEEGTNIAFTSNGCGHVHLTGYLVSEDNLDLDDMEEGSEEEEEEDEEEIPQLISCQPKRKAQEPPKNAKSAKRNKVVVEQEESSDEDDDAESDEEDEDSPKINGGANEEDDSDDLEDGDDDEEDDLSEDEEEEVKVEVKPQSKKQKQQQKEQQQLTKKEKQKLANGKDVKQEQTSQQQKKGKPEQQQQQQQKKIKGEQPQQQQQQQQQKKGKAEQQQQQQAQKKRTVEGGVQVEDIKVGTGAPAKSGKFVSVYYVGRLTNGKKFDSTTQGDGFKFRLGKGEVIKGWDAGISGMKIGGKRRITIPPGMAYGAKGSPPVIPGNSTLIFEVELKNVN